MTDGWSLCRRTLVETVINKKEIENFFIIIYGKFRWRCYRGNAAADRVRPKYIVRKVEGWTKSLLNKVGRFFYCFRHWSEAYFTNVVSYGNTKRCIYLLQCCHSVIPSSQQVVFSKRKQRIEKSKTPAGLGGRVAVASDSKEFYSWSWSYSLSCCCEYQSTVSRCMPYVLREHWRQKFPTQIPNHPTS